MRPLGDAQAVAILLVFGAALALAGWAGFEAGRRLAGWMSP